jgi:hypothetical protein
MTSPWVRRALANNLTSQPRGNDNMTPNDNLTPAELEVLPPCLMDPSGRNEHKEGFMGYCQFCELDMMPDDDGPDDSRDDD